MEDQKDRLFTMTKYNSYLSEYQVLLFQFLVKSDFPPLGPYPVKIRGSQTGISTLVGVGTIR